MLGQARSVYILFFLITYVIRLREPPYCMTHSDCMVKIKYLSFLSIFRSELLFHKYLICRLIFARRVV